MCLNKIHWHLTLKRIALTETSVIAYRKPLVPTLAAKLTVFQKIEDIIHIEESAP